MSRATGGQRGRRCRPPRLTFFWDGLLRWLAASRAAVWVCGIVGGAMRLHATVLCALRLAYALHAWMHAWMHAWNLRCKFFYYTKLGCPTTLVYCSAQPQGKRHPPAQRREPGGARTVGNDDCKCTTQA